MSINTVPGRLHCYLVVGPVRALTPVSPLVREVVDVVTLPDSELDFVDFEPTPTEIQKYQMDGRRFTGLRESSRFVGDTNEE